jgi:hypothetical protein
MLALHVQSCDDCFCGGGIGVVVGKTLVTFARRNRAIVLEGDRLLCSCGRFRSLAHRLGISLILPLGNEELQKEGRVGVFTGYTKSFTCFFPRAAAGVEIV